MFCRKRRRRNQEQAFHGVHSNPPGGDSPGGGPWGGQQGARSGLESPNPHKLYREPENGRVAGVCAGVANYLGISPLVVRVLTIVSIFAFPPPTIVGYILLALILPVKPPNLYRNEKEETFWRQVSMSPERTLHSLRHKRKALDQRLAAIEALVTSEEFELRREFRDLGRH